MSSISQAIIDEGNGKYNPPVVESGLLKEFTDALGVGKSQDEQARARNEYNQAWNAQNQAKKR